METRGWHIVCVCLVYKFECTKMSPAHPSSQTANAQAQNAWITRFDPALVDAQPFAKAELPLAGLTFAVKDNIDVAGQLTTAACPAFAHTPTVSATVVQRLLQSGAALVGKTNLDQFACGLNGTRSPYGAVPNAFNAQFVSGGSSSGSAYAVATGQVDFSLGTDTAGSGRVPAGLNNIVGFKPTRGRISAAGVVPAAQSVDVVSIFARTVPMAWRVLQAAAGFDPLDPYSRGPRELPWRTSPYPKQARIGVPDALEFFGDTQASLAFELAIKQLERMGNQIVRVNYAPLQKAADLLYGSALVAERYVAIRSFFDAHEQQVIEPVRGIIAKGRDYSAADLYEAQRELQKIAAQVRPMWEAIDLLVVPTAPTHVRIDSMLQDPVELNRRLGFYTNFVNLLDYAALSVPSSIGPGGMPFGITFIGQGGSDWSLAEIGARYHAMAHRELGLPLGATGMPPSEQDLGPLPAPESRLTQTRDIEVAVVGAHLSGMPLNDQLTQRGARLLRKARTAPVYRLYALQATEPAKPGLLRVHPDQGAAIELEIWSMPVENFGSFVALIPAPLGIGRLKLEDGQEVQGFVCEPLALEHATDITAYGGWRAYLASLQAHAQPS